MAKKTYRGSCHCGRVKFEADIDLAAGTSKCNCSICWKRRWWGVKVKPEDFRMAGGEDGLVRYRSATKTERGGFCPTCGILPYSWVDKADWNDGEAVSVNVATLDDLDPVDLVATPVQLCDGRNDNWWNVPAEARHL